MLGSLKDLVLTRDAKQRIRLAHSGLASVLLLAAVAAMHGMAAFGVNDGKGLWPWTVASVTCIVTLFAAIRFGWSARLKDPSLTVVQLLFAVACSASAYRVAGAGHGAPLLMVSVVLMFGMFGLRAVQAWLIGGYSVLAFGLAMYSGVRARPDIYDPRVQLAYFICLILFVCGLTAVSQRVSAMRDRLRAQRAELAAALERISLLATSDDLTGLLNRRAMSELLERERQRSDRAGHAWCVAILDIDHFKRINDVHGHAAGDEALRVVARVCTKAMRSCDAVARWGGEEFVLLFRDVDPAHAVDAAERIRASVAASPVSFGAATFGLTASIGVATHQRGDEIAQTLSRADRALYMAKVAGRDRVRDATTG
ncbi:GGDEF domain-containing protein [Lysobacter sp. TY2-98]|uniref:GGDEF domain-containing protein n=1 Tax=Lysobacter sp. TY2-98 TaxID=2290922 RepID=UPI000E201CB4|nr:GGDEF domain-containing protein [Lysobacter sp. TY2-98]AXK72197.1 GGDEF domain-containing protein [Lysobacter sp. TY2-98]